VSLLKRDYLLFAAYDLFQMFEVVVERALFKCITQFNGELSGLTAEEEPRRQALNERIASLHRARSGTTDLVTRLPGAGFRDLCRKRATVPELPENIAGKLRQLGDDLSLVVEEGERSGRVSQRVIDLLDSPREEITRRMYRERFGEDPLP
jgi:hypothetical protein